MAERRSRRPLHCPWQHQRERTPGADLALDSDIAAHRAREIAADGEPEPSAFVLARPRTPELNERLEDGGELVGSDAHAVVLNGDAHVVALRGAPYGNGTA